MFFLSYIAPCSLQVWIIADGVPGFPTETPGAVCHRLGVGPMKPKGQSWDYGIGVSSQTACQPARVTQTEFIHIVPPHLLYVEFPHPVLQYWRLALVST